MSSIDAVLDEELEPAGGETESVEEAELALQRLEERVPRVAFGQPGEHKLAQTWSFWINRRNFFSRSSASADTYVKGVRKICTFNTAEGFWSAYSHLLRPNELPSPSDLSLFKDPITPMWEDDANKEGGKWIIRLRKGFTSKYWEELVLALIGDQFSDEGICGAVVSPRYYEDIISVWNSNAHDSSSKPRVVAELRRLLRIPASIPVEYKAHDQSIRDGSSFRNTNVVRGAAGAKPAADREPTGGKDELTPAGRWAEPATRRWTGQRREGGAEPPAAAAGDWKETAWDMPLE